MKKILKIRSKKIITYSISLISKKFIFGKTVIEC